MRAGFLICRNGAIGNHGYESTKRYFIEFCAVVAQTTPPLSGAEIVRRIDEGDKELLQALTLSPTLGSRRISQLSEEQFEEMCDSGLVDVCLGKLRFPESIDVELEQQCDDITLNLNLLDNSLTLGAFGIAKDAKLNDDARIDACQKIGPAILACTTNKCRLYERTEHWWASQWSITSLFAACMLAEGTSSKVLLKEFDQAVTRAVMEHVAIATLTVDPTCYLPPDAPLNSFALQDKSSINALLD